jgi:hypothetical protein
MYSKAKGLIACIALAALAACGDARTEPLLPPDDALMGKGRQGTLAFSSTTDYSVQYEQTATGAPGAIQFTGSLTTPTPCYDVTASHRTGGSQVTLTVSARATGGGCIQVIANHNYEGAISRLASGTYDFEVIHEVGTSRSVVFSDVVTVQ